jgi:tetratricopeptide (TPR) repeat protein
MAVLVLGGCVSSGRKAAMRAGLDSINAVNRSGQPFTVADVKPYVEFFDDHGTPNDRLLAHYLLGLAYYDHGEAPMALQCYQEALDYADTTATDCDYAQLSRVYAQMGEIFYHQGLFHQHLDYYRQATKYAWRGKDTIAALVNEEQKKFAYYELGMIDSSIIISEKVAMLFTEYGYHSDAAITLGGTIRTLINKGDYTKAKHYMDIYESESGLFDIKGNIEKGREYYYSIKGNYCLRNNLYDSAEYYFKKGLREGKDFNNQNAVAKGLAELYQRLHQPDSAAKYYRYAYAMNDSMYAQQATETVERMQSMYDYSRNQELAKKKTKEAQQNRDKWLLTLTLFFGFVVTVSVWAYRIVRKRREGLELYMQSLEELKELRMEKDALSQHQEEYSQILLEKDKKIKDMEQRVEKYGKLFYFKMANAERCLLESPTYRKYEKMAIHGQRLLEEDWTKLRALILEFLPGFDDFLATHLHELKTHECRIIMLLRLHFKAVDITGMIGMSKSQVSQSCTEIMRKIFHRKGSSKELSAKLNKIF